MLGNLFRDQLDRYGEMEALADEWARTVAGHEGSSAFALNADDPLIADLGRDADERPRDGVLYFGIDDASQALPELQHAFDAKHCRRCGHPYAYERAFVGHLGHYSCPNCGAQAPDAGRGGDEDRAAGDERLALDDPHPRGGDQAATAAAGPLQRLQRPGGGHARGCGSASPRSGSRPRWARCGPPSAGSRRSRSTASPSRSC